MTEHREDPQAEDRIEDLDVPESESDEVKGGVSLNYSKIEFSYRSQKVMPTDQISGPGAGG
jgi:hypothetical protein